MKNGCNWNLIRIRYLSMILISRNGSVSCSLFHVVEEESLEKGKDLEDLESVFFSLYVSLV